MLHVVNSSANHVSRTRKFPASQDKAAAPQQGEFEALIGTFNRERQVLEPSPQQTVDMNVPFDCSCRRVLDRPMLCPEDDGSTVSVNTKQGENGYERQGGYHGLIQVKSMDRLSVFRLTIITPGNRKPTDYLRSSPRAITRILLYWHISLPGELEQA